LHLYSTLRSPYGRIVRIVVEEKGLINKINFTEVTTRGDKNPFYKINPSGRVPVLILPNGVIIEDSKLIAWYLDNLEGKPTLHKNLEIKRLEAIARSMLDGTSLWWREYLYRTDQERSDTIIRHERARALRLADVFENQVEKPVLSGDINIAQIVLACVLHGRDHANPEDFPWREGRPKLSAWVNKIGLRTSILKTIPPK